MSADTVITSGSSPSPNPAPSPLPIDLTYVLAAASAHAAGALDAKNAAIAAKNSADADASATAADRSATHTDRVAADADALATAADRVQTGLDRAAVNTAKTDTLAAKDLAVSAKDTAVTNAGAAASDRAAVAALLASFRNVLLGAFANDAAAVAFAAANGITVSDGLMYENTVADKFRIYTGAAWADYDASAQQQSAAASISATNAAAAQAAAETARDGAVTAKNAADADAVATAADRVQTGLDRTAAAGSATAAASSAASAVTAQTASESARDLTLGYKSSTQTLFDSVSAQALTVSGYATSAAASAASAASAVSGLLNLSAAAKAIVTASDVTAVFIYDTTRDTDGGAWRDKCGTNSLGKPPARMAIVCRASASNALTIYDLTDPACPVWSIFIGTNSVTPGTGNALAFTTLSASGVTAANGQVWIIGGSSGCAIIDLVRDEATAWIAGSVWRYNGNLAARNAALGSTQVRASGIVSNDTNAVAATVLPVTQPNPLRCGLPNPTVAIGTAGGVSIIRADGVVVNSASTGAAGSVCFDGANRLWSTKLGVDLECSNAYLTPSWNVASAVEYANGTVGVGGLNSVRATGQNSVAVAGSTGLAQIKLDPTNLANSLVSVTNTTSNTGWMNGFTKCALAESNGDLSNLSATTLFSDDFSTYANTTALQAAYSAGGAAVTLALVGGAMRVTRTASGVSSVYSNALFTGVAGKTYCIEYDYSVGTFTGSLSLAVGLGGGLQGNAFALTSGASGHAVFYYTSTGASYGYGPGFNGTSANAVVTIDNFKVRLCASDKSGAGNHPIIYGTGLTRSVVASGAELAEYGGFSSGNFLQSPNLFHGATDACVMGWWSPQGNSETLFEWGDTARTGNLFLLSTEGNQLMLVVRRGAGTYSLGYAASFPMARAFFCCVVRGAVLELWINGVKVQSVACSTTAFSNASAITNVGILADGSSYPTAGKIAQMRFSTSAPTPDQIAAIYTSEPWVFAANAKTLLSGSSNVQGMSYDTDTDQIAIATAAGTNVFKYPIRTQYISVAGVADAANLSSDNHKAVAFSGGDLVIASAAQVYGSLLATSGLREIAKKRASVPPYDPTWGIYNGVTTDATPTIVASTPILEGRAYRFRATVAAVQYGGTATEKAVYDVTGLVTRDIGGNVVVVSTTTTVSEVTSSMDCVAQANTTAQTLEIKATGKASTRLAWGVELEFYDIGLMGAAA